MNYRLKLFVFNTFCLFSLFLVACTQKNIDPFLHYDLEKSSDSKIYIETNFPHSIKLKSFKKSLLKAGTYQGYSFYLEYYELDNNEDIKNQVLKSSKWKKEKNYYIKIEDKNLDDGILKENSLFFQKDNFILYGVFIGDGILNFKSIIKGFKD